MKPCGRANSARETAAGIEELTFLDQAITFVQLPDVAGTGGREWHQAYRLQLGQADRDAAFEDVLIDALCEGEGPAGLCVTGHHSVQFGCAARDASLDCEAWRQRKADAQFERDRRPEIRLRFEESIWSPGRRAQIGGLLAKRRSAEPADTHACLNASDRF